MASMILRHEEEEEYVTRFSHPTSLITCVGET